MERRTCDITAHHQTWHFSEQIHRRVRCAHWAGGLVYIAWQPRAFRRGRGLGLLANGRASGNCEKGQEPLLRGAHSTGINPLSATRRSPAREWRAPRASLPQHGLHAVAGHLWTAPHASWSCHGTLHPQGQQDLGPDLWPLSIGWSRATE